MTRPSTELAAGAGCRPEQIFKTLVIALPKGLAVAVLPVPSKLSLKAAAAALGVPKATMAERAAASGRPATSSAASRRWASASRCRPWSTRRRCGGTGCCAARANAAWTWRWLRRTWSG